jgi:hypothetical protein
VRSLAGVPESLERGGVVIGFDDDRRSSLHREEISDVLARVVPGGADSDEREGKLPLSLEAVEIASLELEARRARIVSDEDEVEPSSP